MPMVAAVLAEAGLTIGDLSAVAVTVGPGTFTGIRIGLAAAKGLALTAGIPVLGVLTTEALAHAVPPGQRHGCRVLAAVDSKRAEIWVQTFDSDLAPLGPPAAMTPAQAACCLDGRVVVAGDAAAAVLALRPDWVRADAPLDAGVVAGLAAAGNTHPPQPLYLRDADVTLPGVK